MTAQSANEHTNPYSSRNPMTRRLRSASTATPARNFQISRKFLRADFNQRQAPEDRSQRMRIQPHNDGFPPRTRSRRAHEPFVGFYSAAHPRSLCYFLPTEYRGRRANRIPSSQIPHDVFMIGQGTFDETNILVRNLPNAQKEYRPRGPVK